MTQQQYISTAINWFQAEAHSLAKAKGWYRQERSFLELSGLIYSEIGEAVDAFREPSKPSRKIPDYSWAEEELADIYIRIADMCGYYHYDTGERIAEWTEKTNPSCLTMAYVAESFDGFRSVIDALCIYGDEMPSVTSAYDADKDINAIERLGLIGAGIGQAIERKMAFYNRTQISLCLSAVITELALLANDTGARLADAIIAKHQYNQGRPERHGGKLY